MPWPVYGSKRRIPQTQEMFDNYGQLNGDNDILHYDDAFAKARGSAIARRANTAATGTIAAG